MHQKGIYYSKNIPNIDKQINQYHIASYLGITTIQLSRYEKIKRSRLIKLNYLYLTNEPSTLVK